MPTITIYLDADLYDQVRKTGMPVSKICQTVLRAAVARGGRFATDAPSAQTTIDEQLDGESG